MDDYIIKGTTDIPLKIRRSTRAKRISLRVSRLDGRVSLTIPPNATQEQALAFARQKEAWIRKYLDEHPVTVSVASGCTLPVEGRMHHVKQGKGQKIIFQDNAILVPGKSDQMAARLHGHLVQMARDRLVSASDRYAARLGKRFQRITLRDTRSRWGSCSSKGNLMFSWRLIMAPPNILEYVAAHEVAHLAQMNHSPAFWHEVERIFGDHQPARFWLKSEGHSLHRYQFGN